MGETVVDHRSSWVRRVATEAGTYFVKTYEYSSWGDRLGNWAKWTAPFRRSRAARECQALTWLRQHGFAAPEPLACFEWRTLGFLHRATLLTAAFDGEASDRLLAEVEAPERTRIAAAIGAFVVALHERGFRDRNLDLRNLLVHRRGDDLTIAKIDSPRFRLVAPGRREDALAIADWNRLLPQLAHFGVAEQARRPGRPSGTQATARRRAPDR